MAECRTDRIHLRLSPAVLSDLEDYRAIAEKASLSDTIRCLVRLALRGSLPAEHSQVLKRMEQQQDERSPTDRATLLEKYQQDSKRTHITLTSDDRKEIEAYRTAAGIKTLARAIQLLFGISLVGKFPPTHLEIVGRLAIEKPIRDRAHVIWETTGRRPGSAEEDWARAEFQLAKEVSQRRPFILFPAIDLKDGACVRLVRGDMASATVFNDNPAAQAQTFAELGFRWLHIVDLDGAFAGHSVNGEAVRAIRRAVDLHIQLGGGIRDRAAVDRWIDLGIDRLVLGTAALRDPELVRRAAADYPDRVVVAIDARDGRVAVEGWAQTSGVGAVELARRFADAGVAAIVYTDIARDGALSGTDAPAVAGFARQLQLPVIAAGGVASLNDIAALGARAENGIDGAICGRALYDGRLDAREALRLVAGAATQC